MKKFTWWKMFAAGIHVKKTLTGLIIIFVTVFSTSIAFCIEDNYTIYISHSKYIDFYHIKFTLTPDNTFLRLKTYYKYGPSKYEFCYSGGFTIFIPKDKFPVPAPNCDEYIILRMPGTSDDSGNKRDKYIAEKQIIFDKIKQMKETNKGSVDVVIELNPEITVKSKEPLNIELTYSNVYFRQAYGRYIDYVGQLRSE